MMDLPKDFGSSLVAAIAAGAPAATAIPPPIPARPVTIPAASNPMPFEESLFVSCCAVAAVLVASAAAVLLLVAADTEIVIIDAIIIISTNVARLTLTAFFTGLPSRRFFIAQKAVPISAIAGTINNNA
ncbi:hypothetical protein SDC9_105500 [bioreactor metagenome]|uniref:Uncharacterized protein n=1 Tax=bioreactor metagenome TaxID=1076179 RepID=A0A645AZS9_9ZZZZ